jgi:hypothetical protein
MAGISNSMDGLQPPDFTSGGPHSVNLFVPVESREAAVKALHSLI